MKIFKHNGKKGDIIFSLPTIRELGGGILYLPESSADDCLGLHSEMKDLLLQQPYIREVREYPSGLWYGQQAPGIHIDYNLDDARHQTLKGVIHIVKRYLNTFDIQMKNWQAPWLMIDQEPALATGKYSLMNYTGRHITNDKMAITSRVNWSKVLRQITEDVFFVGTEQEHYNFSRQWANLPFIPTANVLELARLVRDAHSVYCNQSLVLALVQSMGKTYYLDVKPNKTNCLLYTKNENILQ